MKFAQPRCEKCGSKDNCLLNVCSTDELEQISDSKSCNFYKKGQIIFQEDSLPIGLYCLNTGMVKIVKLGSNGKEQILRIAKAGDFLGYRSLIGNTRYRASAVALEDSTACLIPKTEFSQLIRQNVNFYDGIMKMLCEVIENAETKITDIAYKPVRGRIAEALIMLDQAFADREQITLTREDLAGFVGTVKETAIRIISEFKNEKLIEINKRSIKVLNPEGLLRISNLYD
jgi:CRP-like cAMP-binding protein